MPRRYRLLVPAAVVEAMIAQARAELPNECCGLLAGTVEDGAEALGRVVERYPLVNAAASATRYASEPRGMFNAVKDMRRRGLDVLAVYHSHPTAAAVPSATDLANSYDEGVMNLILGMTSDPPVIRGWWLRPGACDAGDWVTIREAGG